MAFALRKQGKAAQITGADFSHAMLVRARAKTTSENPVAWIESDALHLPFPDHSFDLVSSAFGFRNLADYDAGLREIFRVLRPGGSAWILINYYRDNPYCHQWSKLLKIPAHLFSAEEWAGMFRKAGFVNVTHRRIVDPTPAPEVYSGRWFKDAAELAAFRREGALLIIGTK